MKYIAALLLFTLFSCKSIELAEMNKQLVTPGQPSGVITFRYSTSINITSSTLIKSISVSKIDRDIATFSITDLATGTMYNQKQVLETGNYFIDFNVGFSEELRTSIDTVTFKFEIDGKEKIVSKKAMFSKDVNMK